MFSSNSPASAKVLSALYLVGATSEVLDVAPLPHAPPTPPAEPCRKIDPKQPVSGNQDTLFLASHMVIGILAGEYVLRKKPKY